MQFLFLTVIFLVCFSLIFYEIRLKALKIYAYFILQAQEKFNEFMLRTLESIESSDSLDNLSDIPGLSETSIQVIKATNVKFDDIAGNEEAKEELLEVVKFLKDPTIFEKLGASLPKGVLLGGPPGTGKTLLAKAVAGEAGVTFIKTSGSQFVELLVGVGASRVREVFEKARSLKPSIIFIDEIDSIARTRSTNLSMGGGNDEREQTLNQLLTEMDGFKVNNGIVVIAATNRIDILDPAIKRPGRFDRQITLQNPNYMDREAILKVHIIGKKIDPSVSLSQIAQRTIGFSGAELANLVNEAAILAARRKKNTISMEEFNTSIDRILLGLEEKRISRTKARLLAAFYESGKAFIGNLINEEETIQKLTLISRANKTGTTAILPSPSQYNSRNSFIKQVAIAISGRASEEIITGNSEITIRGQEDFSQITRNLREMILRYAMARLQQLKQETQERNLFLLGSDVKSELNNLIDNFTTNFIDVTYEDITSFLKMIRPGKERIVDELLQKEEISGKILSGLVQEYLSNLVQDELIYNTRKSLIAKIIIPELKKK